MTVSQLIQLLEENKDSSLYMMLPSGAFIPDHFHVTEVGRILKTFVDCGGTRRETESCLIQVWTANDIEHRLKADKLYKILKLAKPILDPVDLSVEVEYGVDVASQYTLSSVEVTPKGLLFYLMGKKTDCLAPDKCGITCCKDNERKR